MTVAPVLDRYGDFAAFLEEPLDEVAAYRALRRAETSGRPVDDADWIAMLEERMRRRLTPQKRGSKAGLSVKWHRNSIMKKQDLHHYRNSAVLSAIGT